MGGPYLGSTIDAQWAPPNLNLTLADLSLSLDLAGIVGLVAPGSFQVNLGNAEKIVGSAFCRLAGVFLRRLATAYEDGDQANQNRLVNGLADLVCFGGICPVLSRLGFTNCGEHCVTAFKRNIGSILEFLSQLCNVPQPINPTGPNDPPGPTDDAQAELRTITPVELGTPRPYSPGQPCFCNPRSEPRTGANSILGDQQTGTAFARSTASVSPGGFSWPLVLRRTM